MSTKIYTRTGDRGDTGLFGGRRVRKNDLRVEAYGAVDELNAVLGAARSQEPDSEIGELLRSIQDDLLSVGADLATPNAEDEHRGKITIQRIAPQKTDALEPIIDRFESVLAPLQNFILPGGHPVASNLHLARTVCRRAERCCVTLADHIEQAGEQPINAEVIRYLNRLSDLLFVMARLANHSHGVEDIPWRS